MNFVIKVTIFLFVIVTWDLVKCLPLYRVKNLDKKVYFEVIHLPRKHFAFVLDKVKPLGRYELKHVIHKRQILQNEMPPNEIRVNDVIAFEEFPKPPEIIEKKEEERLVPEVFITSIIKPIENNKAFSFVLPEQSEVLIRPADKGEVIKAAESAAVPEPIVPQSILPQPIIPEPIIPQPILPEPIIPKPILPQPIIPEPIVPQPIITQPIIPEPIIPAPVPKPVEAAPPLEHVVEITPKPVIIPPSPEPQPIVQNVEIKTPIESTVPPIFRVPLFQNAIRPFPSPVVNNIPNVPLLYTDISRIPLTGVPYPAPVGVPIAEVPPPPPPPPPTIIEPPVIKEPPIIKEPPNFFVKGSRFVLYFGSMMLQMLSQLVNGQINLNQPLPAGLPGL